MNRPTVYSERAARQLDSVAVDVAKAQAARDLAEANAVAQTAQLRAERERQEILADLRAVAEGERQRRVARRRAERAAQWTERRAGLARQGALLATVAVIVLFVVVALPAQISFLAQRWPLPMALAGGVAMEALTWVFALKGQTRHARGFSAAVHHLGIWAAAAVAAGINLAHGAELWGLGFATVAACGSLPAPITWHMYLISQRADRADPEQVRRKRRRRRRHREVARMADWLTAALPQEVADDQAWTLAWRAVHGAEPGITADLLEAHGEAAARVAQQLRPGDRASVMVLEHPVFARPLWRAMDARAVVASGFEAARPVAELLGHSSGCDVPARAAKARTGAYSQVKGRTAVRTATRRPARTTVALPTSDDVVIEAKRRAARAAIRRTLTRGGIPSPTEIGRAHGMSPEWGAKQIRAVRNEVSDRLTHRN